MGTGEPSQDNPRPRVNPEVTGKLLYASEHTGHRVILVRERTHRSQSLGNAAIPVYKGGLGDI